MFFSSILVEYIKWHYGGAITNYVRLVRTGRDFILYFFSLPLLLRTLFSPYKRIQEPRTRRFSFEDWAGQIIINALSRIIGFILRISIIILGLLFFVAFMIISVFGFAFWIASPIIVIMSIISGAIILISSTL